MLHRLSKPRSHAACYAGNTLPLCVMRSAGTLFYMCYAATLCSCSPSPAPCLHAFARTPHILHSSHTSGRFSIERCWLFGFTIVTSICAYVCVRVCVRASVREHLREHADEYMEQERKHLQPLPCPPPSSLHLPFSTLLGLHIAVAISRCRARTHLHIDVLIVRDGGTREQHEGVLGALRDIELERLQSTAQTTTPTHAHTAHIDTDTGSAPPQAHAQSAASTQCICLAAHPSARSCIRMRACARALACARVSVLDSIECIGPRAQDARCTPCLVHTPHRST